MNVEELFNRANNGDSSAMLDYAISLSDSAKTLRDMDNAANWFIKAAEAGKDIGNLYASNEYCLLADNLLENGKYQIALEYYSKSSEYAFTAIKNTDYFENGMRIIDQIIYGMSVSFYLSGHTIEAIKKLSMGEKSKRNTILMCLCNLESVSSNEQLDSIIDCLIEVCTDVDGYANSEYFSKCFSIEQSLFAIAVKQLCGLIQNNMSTSVTRAGVDADKYANHILNIARGALTQEYALSIVNKE